MSLETLWVYGPARTRARIGSPQSQCERRADQKDKEKGFSRFHSEAPLRLSASAPFDYRFKISGRCTGRVVLTTACLGSVALESKST